ncbi:NAD(P)-dependent dehydrogenase, short-chain alcohol dehydrogenase family [Pseudomonas citronellolis]|uniref:NAD(P)-dependent dehydrogenase, short-chain alcohol dehydrogenase family n=1 Tax=Pseudomonas citronellolis TaxID=53408 RepID=A0AAQ1HT34_9PSED|nr:MULTISPECIES: glucose 1-dehydrogenase [Pseudomonas]MCL6692956.1 SDR family oxidoreductase [Pseudomonas sp. R3.Fl]MCP1604072.1 NAD(P)-dependent dehydrogenase (short-subunit alcohol dehydrogenase family) [Pseudomonas citronellolis]MCP1657256.1 NAD(P)-dependent dehydrogenase (short-subunit alcohol dehydrogenase family) [Pseudomonas citronellolis]MCP1721840.1 NAD(P)-dependent dehydrogenase (short-subunit alcohol dehydrogenase family) [Pseudomonas citronellolis]MED5607885.1 glucose 1-dehydrogena
MGRLQDKVCLVTGAARGIGLATAELFAREGARVLLTDLDQAAGLAAANALGGQGLSVGFLQQDVTDEAQWRKTFDFCERLFGGLDVLVNNAGVGAFCDVERMTLEQWRHTLACNLDSVFLGTQLAIGRMRARGGSIINVASIEGLIGEPLVPAYNASKGGVRLFTRSVAAHCARRGYAIRINALCPGYVETPMVQGALAAAPDEQAQDMLAYLRQRIPMGRMARAEEIAKAMLFLASDDSSYMTGADLVVDGGYLAQ